METVNRALGAVSRYIWGAGGSKQQREQHGEEPLSGVTGKGTGTDPYDAGNRDVQPGASSTQAGGIPVPTYGVKSDSDSSSSNSSKQGSSSPSTPYSEQQQQQPPQTPYQDAGSNITNRSGSSGRVSGGNSNNSGNSSQLFPDPAPLGPGQWQDQEKNKDPGSCTQPLAQHSGAAGGSERAFASDDGRNSRTESVREQQQQPPQDPEHGARGACREPLAQHSEYGRSGGSSSGGSSGSGQSGSEQWQQQQQQQQKSQEQGDLQQQEHSSSQGQEQGQEQLQSQQQQQQSQEQEQQQGQQPQEQRQSQSQEQEQGQGQKPGQEQQQQQQPREQSTELRPYTSEEARKGPQSPLPNGPGKGGEGENLDITSLVARGEDTLQPAMREDVPGGASKPGKADAEGGHGKTMNKLKGKLHLNKNKQIGS